MPIFICDSAMGSGKTSAAIAYMNAHPDKKFLYVTPYLSEVERIKSACPALNFKTPSSDKMPKLDHLNYLLARQENIVSTHALFGTYTNYTVSLIAAGYYTLIMDEVFSVVEAIKINSDDVDQMFRGGLVAMAEDNEHIDWVDGTYNGTRFTDVRGKAEMNNLIRYKNKLMYWTFPVETFEAFEDVYILTYMFDAQIQRYYYDMHGIEYTYMGTRREEDGTFCFSYDWYVPEYLRTLRDKVHVLDDEKLNRIGDARCALSANWHRESRRSKEQEMVKTLRNNIYNVCRNRWHAKSDDVMWTAFKSSRTALEGKGYKKGFVSCNARATNEYAHKTHLAYCVNIFIDPDLAGYFRGHGITVDGDRYALSEMVQWVWRSAIRSGEEIWLYVPSKRMRDLFTDWLDRLAAGERC